MKRWLSFLVLFFLVHFANSQLEAANWYFGFNAGVSFKSGNPVALTDGALHTNEGCSAISDNLGNLLFYSDGVTVWDRRHTPMPNGTGLYGSDDSTQSAIIIPKPNSSNIYYVVTVDKEGGTRGMNYSEVDMTLNGGLGDITSVKNVNLIALSTEKVTAVKSADESGYWLIGHPWNSNSFHSFYISPTGINTTPVISTTPLTLPIPPSTHTNFAVGQMKVSPDGKKLAMCVTLDGTYVFDFDPQTGIVSNMVQITNRSKDYGVEFSPTGAVLYIGNDGATGMGKIYQYKVNAPDIKASETLIRADYNLGFALQLAIDGKIYTTDVEGYLSSIDNPNVLGLGCNFNFRSVDLQGRWCRAGLPPFIQSYFYVDLDIKNFCLGDITEFRPSTSDTVLNIAWDFGDGNSSNDEYATHIYNSPGNYTVNVTATTINGTSTETKDITIYETPVANKPSDLVECNSSGSRDLNLSSLNPGVLGSQDPNDLKVDYFQSQSDADSNINSLEYVHSFNYGVTPVFVRVSNKSNQHCYDTTQFNIIVREAPNVPNLTDWTVCDDDMDGFSNFDLSQKNQEVFDGQDEKKFEIHYFSSHADAAAGTNSLPLNYTNSAATEEIFVRIQNSTYTDCYSTGSFVIEVSKGVTANHPTDMSICDDNNDGQAVFDLTQTEMEILGTQNPNSLNLTFHETQEDADSGVNTVNASSYLSTAYQNTIYIRVENVSDTSCYDTTFFNLNIYDTPVVPQMSDWQVCDDNNDGFFLFDLLEKETEILSGTTETNVSFYISQADAQTAQNRITGNYQNTDNPQTIYFRLENTNKNQCNNTGSFQLQVFDTPLAYTASDIIICDTDETGRYYFDLSQKDLEILNGQDPLYYDISYHSSEDEALSNLSPLSKADYQNKNLKETIWVRIQHADLESCFDVSSFNLMVNPILQLNLEERYVICPDSPDLVINGGTFESYSWRNENGSEIGDQATLNITYLGDYSLTVTQTSNGIVCENTAYFEVVSSGAPETLEVDLNGFSDEIDLELIANGIGEFEYSIDGENYQSSNNFRVFPGQYTVYVRDIYECRTLTEEVFAMGYQRFFTPNGDGLNENWKIIGSEMYVDAQLFIYDRYGKLLQQLPHNTTGWDGTFQGQPMPASDYWFRFIYDQNRVYSGHFTLKR